MKWFIPSWNGDFRLESVTSISPSAVAPAADCVKLVITEPTAHERETLAVFLSLARSKKWTELTELPDGNSEIVLATSLAKAGDELVKLLQPRDRSITAVSFSDGSLKVVDAAKSGALVAAAAKAHAAAIAKEAKAVEPKAVSVKRATPCCPQCVPGSVKMASEVLLSFLTAAQHRDWAKQRAIVVVGGTTGRRYILAHRHSKSAQEFGRICYGVDDNMVIHFHDNSVPPEEEVLGAKLILEHRESWLRNEATMWMLREKLTKKARDVLKNPFGNLTDGTLDASFMKGFGIGIQALVT